MLTNTDCTLYNRYKTPKGDIGYKRTYLPKVFWEIRKGANIINSGLTSADALLLYIPYSDDYQDPISFAGDQKGWTLTEGYDYVIKGNVPDQTTEEPPEDETEEETEEPPINEDTIKRLRKQHHECYKITTVDPKMYGSKSMHHWEVGGV